MIILRIFIVGFVALLPTQDKDGNKSLTIVVATMPPHVPVIVFPTSDAATYAAETRQAACWLDIIKNLDNNGPLDNGCKGCAAIKLNRQTLSIKNPVPGSLTFAAGRQWWRPADLLGAVPRTREEARDWSWLPEMDDLAGHHAPMKPEYNNPAPTAAREGLLDLSGAQGSVESYHLAETVEDPDGCHGSEYVGEKWPPSIATTDYELTDTQHALEIYGNGVSFVRPLSFKHQGWPIGSPRQAVTDQVMIEVHIKDPDAVLELLDSNGKTRTIKITPRYGNVVDLLIANLTPLPDQKKPDNCSKEQKNGWPPKALDMKCRLEVGHYPHYYEMAENGGDPQKIAFGMDWRRIESSRINLPEDQAPGVILAVSVPTGSFIKGGVARPLCTPLGYTQ